MTTLLALVLFGFLIFYNRSLSARLSALELKFKEGRVPIEKKSEPKMDTVQPVGFIATLKSESDNPPAYLKENTLQPVENQNQFTNWLKEDWLMKLGAFLFVVGFGWFVSYAFANNWIGPIGRISVGIIFGVIIMALGFWRMVKYPAQGAVFMALGGGMAILTIFAGRSVYGFFTPISAVGFDFIIVAFISFASYKFNVKSLGFIAQVLAFISPLLVAGITDSVFLFSYLFFISMATLFLASVTGWKDLIVSSLIFVGLYSIPYVGAGSFGSSMFSTDGPIILNFAYLFSMMYLVSGIFSVIKKGVQNINTEILLATLNGLFIFMWVLSVADKDWQSIIFASLALVFSIGSFIAFRFSSQLAPFYAYGSVAVAFIATATALELSGTALIVAFTFEVLFLVVSVFFLTKNIKITSAVSWLFVAPIMLSFESISKYANSQELFTKDFFALVVIAAALIIAGRVITHFGKQEQEESDVNAGSVLIVFGVLYLGYILWQFIHISMVGAPDIATMTTLVIYTIFGLIAYFSGLYGNDTARRVYGVTLLAFVVIRLIFVDVWQMELFGRVVTFLAIGVLLMSTAFLTKKKKQETIEKIIIK